MQPYGTDTLCIKEGSEMRAKMRLQEIQMHLRSCVAFSVPPKLTLATAGFEQSCLQILEPCLNPRTFVVGGTCAG